MVSTPAALVLLPNGDGEGSTALVAGYLALMVLLPIAVGLLWGLHDRRRSSDAESRKPRRGRSKWWRPAGAYVVVALLFAALIGIPLLYGALVGVLAAMPLTAADRERLWRL